MRVMIAARQRTKRDKLFSRPFLRRLTEAHSGPAAVFVDQLDARVLKGAADG